MAGTVKTKSQLVQDLMALLADGLTGDASTFMENVSTTYASMESNQAGSGDKLLNDLCSAKTKTISIITKNFIS